MYFPLAAEGFARTMEEMTVGFILGMTNGQAPASARDADEVRST